MSRIVNNLPWLLPMLALAGLLTYSLWYRDLPKADGRITGDYAAAAKLAAADGVPLLVAVDHSPR
jgi:hypothetical protein